MPWWDNKRQQWQVMTADRWAICSRCPELYNWHGRMRCRQCGCFMALKTKVPIAHCPLGYW